MKQIRKTITMKLVTLAQRTRRILADDRGEAFVEVAVRILIIIVLGALLLAGLYALFGDVVLPTLKLRIQEMFNFAG